MAGGGLLGGARGGGGRGGGDDGAGGDDSGIGRRTGGDDWEFGICMCGGMGSGRFGGSEGGVEETFCGVMDDLTRTMPSAAPALRQTSWTVLSDESMTAAPMAISIHQSTVAVRCDALRDLFDCRLPGRRLPFWVFRG